ncbi:HD domain-containing phosphohydrolase [Leptolinea tardivitalis]|uniref:HD-GYP domain-containing protein n=1 Tax=Leptolinea tardivitalis TaxID=229920 RepID=A0A0P6X6C3_9CHLR|nr:HD domain-containing phosphohydrolase [Leptolinea tardivitalis]KPL70488.1 hypothetical protein ADM99_15265 [Leptolinea tardivitalis]GAP22079.1 protein containing HD-GYP domain [Leptolinea tardivitalis]
MEEHHPTASIFDLVLCISEAVDLVSPLVADHHRRTAQIAYGLAVQLGLPEEVIKNIVIAAALHDVGGLTRQDRLGALDFEYQDPYGHPIRGYLLLKSFQPLAEAAEIVRFHHVSWKNGEGANLNGIPVSPYSHLLHLADRIAVLIDPNMEVLDQVDGIVERIQSQVGDRFHPLWFEGFISLSKREAFWLDTVYYLSLNTMRRRLDWQVLSITDEEFKGFSNLFRRIIDFRSPYTSTHSVGVATCAKELGQLYGLGILDCRMLHLAGLLHDLGKLAIPAEILEKPDKLTSTEFETIRRHTYHTFRIMETLQILDVVRLWSAYHHESMDGKGYPFHLTESDLPLGSRIVSVADIFTALTENRPYRKGLSPDKALSFLQEASKNHRVDQQLVDLLGKNMDVINEKRIAAQQQAEMEYQDFLRTAELLTPVIAGEKESS